MTPEEKDIEKAMNCLHAHADDCECCRVLAALKESRMATWKQVQRAEKVEAALKASRKELAAKTQELEVEREKSARLEKLSVAIDDGVWRSRCDKAEKSCADLRAELAKAQEKIQRAGFIFASMPKPELGEWNWPYLAEEFAPTSVPKTEDAKLQHCYLDESGCDSHGVSGKCYCLCQKCH